MIEIDGSYGEGGGQILRMAVALAALLDKPVKIGNIRVKRSTSGLKRQHITAIEAVKNMCGGRVEGAREHSLSLCFYPGSIIGGAHCYDIGTAGSITLVLQACILPSLFAEKETKIVITGGTDVKWAPPWDYFQHVFFPLLKTMGVHVEGRLVRRGYYPRGMGKAEVLIRPCRALRPPCFDDASPAIEGRVNIANLPRDIAERVKHAAAEELTREGLSSSIAIREEEAASPGVGIVLWTRTGRILGGDCLGERGVRAEAVGVRAAHHLIWELKAGVDVDEHAVDQILPYMALVPTSSSFTCREISTHADTEMWLLKNFLDVHFEIKKREGKKEIRIQTLT